MVLSWSGGKDSALALARLRADPHIEVVGLLTTMTAGYDRVSIHGVRRSLLHAQAEALALPLQEVTLAPESSNDAYDAALADALGEVRARMPDVRRVTFGDIFLEDVRQYREDRVRALGFGALFPLWGESTNALARELFAREIEARLVCVDTQVLPAAYAGRRYDATLLAELPGEVDPCGERGEFHTFVSAGPGFRQPVPYSVGDVVLRDERFAFCDIVPDRWWGVEHQGRDSFLYKEPVAGRVEQIRVDGEMLDGTPHHVIYFPSEGEWNRRYPRWAQGRRTEIIGRITGELRPPDYEYHYQE